MAAASSTSSFVGRERELGELRRALDLVGSGHGQLLLLSGEPGIGKTRLAEEIAAESGARAVRVMWGRCWEGDGAPAYWPWIQVLRACLTEADAEQRSAILGVEATPQTVQHIAQLLPELHVAHPENLKHPGQPALDPEQARFQLFESVANVLKNVARIAPILIVTDDLHDADHPSLMMQKFIASQTKDARVLMVATYRDTEVRQSQELSKLIGDLIREGHSLPMAGLTESEVGEFVAKSAGTKADRKLVTDLYQATDGNPLFVDGVVRLLLAEGKFDRAWLDGGAFRIPDGARESIRRRLARLLEETNSLLSVASVIGNEFDTRLLSRVSGRSVQQIVDRMEDAIRAGIVIGGEARDKHYRFSHALIREALYQDLWSNRRAEVHGQIGSAIEEVYVDDLKPHLAALAHHFREGGPVDKAIDYSIAAGEEAEAVFAYPAAISHLRPALALSEAHDASNSARRARLLLCLGRIEAFFGDRDAGVAYLEAGLKVFEQLRDEQHAGEVHSHLGHAFHAARGSQMNLTQALLHLRRAQTLLEGTGDNHSLATVYAGLAMANQSELLIDEGMTAAQKAMDLFAGLGERERWARVAGEQIGLLMVKGRHREAVALLREIFAEAATFQNPDAYTLVMYSCAWYHMLMNDPGETARYCKLGMSKSGVMPPSQALLLEWLGIAELAMGNLATLKRSDFTIRAAFRSRCMFYEGDWKAARATMQQVDDWVRRDGAKWEELNVLAYVVELLRVFGDYDGAAAALEHARTLYKPDDVFWEIRLSPHGVMLCFDAGRIDEAAAHLQHCRKILDHGEDWLGQAGPVWRAEAIVAAVEGRFAESDAHFQKAIDILERYTMRWFEADTWHYWGKVLLRAGETHRAQEKLDAAIKIYRDHGAGQCWIDRVEADRPRVQPPPFPSDAAGTEIGTREALFSNEGEFWSIAYLGHSFRLRDMRGLHYIAHLLAHSNERFHVRDLAVLKEPSVYADRGNPALILDHQAKANYRARLSELHVELDQAARMNDSGRAEVVRQELEFVNDELSAAMGLRGRDRKTSDDGERARMRIGKAIRSALNAIRERDPSLGRHLSASIRTGYYCAYLPDPSQLSSWKL